MILFCDTSALVKLYVSEAGTSQITALAQAARGIGVSRISWAESMAAFARRVREQPSSSFELRSEPTGRIACSSKSHRLWLS